MTYSYNYDMVIGMKGSKRLERLIGKRNDLAGKLKADGVVIKGKLHPVYRACGKPYCKCNKDGKIHKTWAISLRKGGRYYSIHIPNDILDEVREGTKRYAALKEMLDEIAGLDLEIKKIRHEEGKKDAKNKRKTS